MRARPIAARTATRRRRPRRSRLVIAAATWTLALLAGCGQKGPLFLPGHSKDTPWPLRTEPPAADPATGAATGATTGNTTAATSAAPASGAPQPTGGASAGTQAPAPTAPRVAVPPDTGTAADPAAATGGGDALPQDKP